MKAIVVTPGLRNSVRLEEVEKPVPEAGQALLRILEVGIDGNDIEINEGAYGEAPVGSKYLIVGHECVAVVEETPEGSNRVTKGDLVVPTVRRPDGCINCANDE